MYRPIEIILIFAMVGSIVGCEEKGSSDQADEDSQDLVGVLNPWEIQVDQQAKLEVSGQTELNSETTSAVFELTLANIGNLSLNGFQGKVGSPWKILTTECTTELKPGEACKVKLEATVDPSQTPVTIESELVVTYLSILSRAGEIKVPLKVNFLEQTEFEGGSSPDANTDEALPLTVNDVGSGKNSNLTVATGTSMIPNTCYPITSTQNQSRLSIQNQVDLAGSNVILWQVQDRFASSGVQTEFADGTTGEAGVWQLAKVKKSDVGVSETILTFEQPLKINYQTSTADGKAAQLCVVPEYDSVSVALTGKITAQPWNGETGGLVAFFAKTTTEIAGSIEVSAQGFRGGTLRGNSGAQDEEGLDQITNPDLGGGKGEGLDPSGFTLSGRGNYANGGGGGNAHNAGGGGGSNASLGGFGGRQEQSAGTNLNTRGNGGAAMTASMSSRLIMGGGGGAGQQNDSRGGTGGAGGGIILIFTQEISGSGSILANGASGLGARDDGAGGGGAGGSIWIQAKVAQTFQGAIAASGGNGGDVTDDSGPGGGGGGGRIRSIGITQSATFDVSGGIPGIAEGGGGDSPRDATAGAAGIIAQ